MNLFVSQARRFTTTIPQGETYLVMTASGPDKVGITSRLVNQIVTYKGNVEESRMTKLGDSFSVMMLLRLPVSEETKLRSALSKVEGVNVAVDKTSFSSVAKPHWKRRIIKLTGADNTGLVAGVANYCANKGINIDNLESHLVRASFSGYPLFNLEASVSIPPGVKIEAFESDIQELGEKLGVDMWVDLWTEPGQ